MKKAAAFLSTPFALLAVVGPLPCQKHEELGRMWTFEHAPLEFFEQEYGVRPTTEWMRHVQLSALRYGGGCSASFVSPRGLIMTNHHCARDHIVEVTPDGEDWLANGYFSGSLTKEPRVPGLSVRQLIGTEDVTQRVSAGESGDEIVAAAKQNDPDATYQVVELYQGGMYQLYKYKIFDDIRLVASPHLQSAKFGGDPDNFTYPRFSLDFTFVRAYENDKPVDSRNFYYKWKTAGPQEGETVFVIGNPGSTGRLNTIAQMEYMRDALYPAQLERVATILDRLGEQAQASEAAASRARTQILRMENTRKALQGYLDGLRNDRVMDIKRAAEKAIRAKIDADPELQKKFADAWTELEMIAAEKIELAEKRQRTPPDLAAREKAAAKRVGEAFFAVYGTDIPPDATFTLRISDGRVTGYEYNGTIAPCITSLYGLYARHTEFGGKPPFNLPKIWIDKIDKLDLTTPFNLVATCDIIGGNSGSPLINANAEIVGLVFDGNIEMLGNRFVFTDEVARTVCVHPAIIIEALREVYGADKLADELEKGRAYK